ncbi:MAG: tyrosine-type recombinase/integrase [Solirubrobacteraceae bacterium]
MREPSRVRVTGPLEPYVAGFAAELAAVGYRPASAMLLMGAVAHLSRWLAAEQCDPAALSPAVVDRFLVARRAAGYKHYLSRRAFAPLLEHLRAVGVVTDEVAEEPVPGGVDALLACWRTYLVQERGLTVEVVRGYVQKARPFLVARADGAGRVELDGLTASDVLAFVLSESERGSRATAKLMVTALRSLLVFLHVRGLIDSPLAQVVPAVASWRLQGLPRGLEREQVQRMLAGCDRGTVVGRRDLAILLMLVRLGMRRGEVAALDLDDLDWRAGEILVHGKGSRFERLPLPVDVGEALADYLCHARPDDALDRAVFVRVRPPQSRLLASGVGAVATAAARRAGLPPLAAHRLRHTAACELLRSGASLVEIGQLLRHRSQTSTAIYAKVDSERLRGLARPWPGVEA